MAGDTHARDHFARLFKELREESGLSYKELERPTLATRGWISNVASGARWPERDWAERADKAVRADGRLLRAWESAREERERDKRLQTLLGTSVRESKSLLSIASDVDDLDELNGNVAQLAVDYLSSPAFPMLERGMALRQELMRRLTSGAFRKQELSDLYVAIGRVSGVLAYAAVDLGHDSTAVVHNDTAWKMADLANDNELRAWVRGTQSLIARFGKDYELARYLINDGMNYAGAGTSTARLLSGAAQCAANLGDSVGAQALLDEANRAREHSGQDSIEGLFAFSYAKQKYYGGSSLMWLPDRDALLRSESEAQEAIELWQHEPVEYRSLDDEALAHVYLATARLKLGEIDSAMDAVRPIIDLPSERQISWIRKRVGELAHLLLDPKFAHSTVAFAAYEELRSYEEVA